MQTPFYVYMLSSRSRVLYIGVTNNLAFRINEHRAGRGSKFCFRYNVFRLVYAEPFPSARVAIAREKQLKGWRRSKKVALIEVGNPQWRDLIGAQPQRAPTPTSLQVDIR
jgi:putative endonuclease